VPAEVLSLALAALWKTALFYFLLVFLLRVTGKREITALTAVDLVVFVMISEAALISVADDKVPLVVGATPVIVLGLLELAVSFVGLKSARLRTLFVGQPSVLVEHGRINERALAELRFSVADLLAALREKQFPNIADVEYAILETTGSLSVIPKAAARPVTAADLQALQLTQPQQLDHLAPGALPAAVIMDGVVDEAALRRTGRDGQWLRQALRSQGIHDPRQVLLASVDGQGQLFVQPRQRLAARRPTGDPGAVRR